MSDTSNVDEQGEHPDRPDQEATDGLDQQQEQIDRETYPDPDPAHPAATEPENP